MVIERLFDTVRTTEYDGSSSSSQQQLTIYNYDNLSDSQFFPQTTIGSSAYHSAAVMSHVRNVSSNHGQNELQIGTRGSPEYQRRSNNDLHYISQMLMEDIDEEGGLYQEEAALHAAEQPFYDILGQVYRLTPNWPPLNSSEQDNPDESNNNNQDKRPCTTSLSTDCSSLSPAKKDCSSLSPAKRDCSSLYMLQSLTSPLSPDRRFLLPNQPLISAGSTSRFGFAALQSRRGDEEVKRFDPSFDKLVIELGSDRLSISRLTTKANIGEKRKYALFEVNNLCIRDKEQPGKHYAITSCAIIRHGKFDRFLLCYGLKSFDEATSLREIMAKEAAKSSLKERAQRKLWGKKQLNKEVVDLEALLIHCSQAVAANDRPLASELLKKIRQNSSADGDCTQRLAFYMADALEARLTGIRSQVSHKLISTADLLKAYSLSVAACPFDSGSYAFANQTIMDVSQGQPRIHIVDFGISYGFQWPSLIQKLGKQQDGAPRLRITGIDVPRPGSRPCEMIEETGKRLADYANMFEVTFQYQGIAASWETIQVEDLNIDKDEVLVVNCMFRMKNLGDETDDIDSARDRVLKTIRRMNPKVFIFGIVNGTHNSPFFTTRFKEVLFHYSSIFDMLDANVPRDNEARKVLERELHAQDALNIIACEGAERTEKPESYRQWQLRCLKAGFEQLPVDSATLRQILDMKNLFYHQDFFADKASGWLLQVWKGRVVYAISKWKCKE